MSREKRYQRWFDNDLNYLKANYQKVSLSVIARVLGRTRHGVAAMATKLRLNQPARSYTPQGTSGAKQMITTFQHKDGRTVIRKEWYTQEVSDFRRDISAKMSTPELSKKYGRSAKALVAKAGRMGLRIPSIQYAGSGTISQNAYRPSAPIAEGHGGVCFCVIDPDTGQTYAEYGMYNTIEQLNDALDETDKQLLQEGSLKIFRAEHYPVTVGYSIREA